jgi:hypothetical protein
MALLTEENTISMFPFTSRQASEVNAKLARRWLSLTNRPARDNPDAPE